MNSPSLKTEQQSCVYCVHCKVTGNGKKDQFDLKIDLGLKAQTEVNRLPRFTK